MSRPTYVACLDCGKEFDYDWKQMRIGRPTEPVSVPIVTLALARASHLPDGTARRIHAAHAGGDNECCFGHSSVQTTERYLGL